MLLAVCLSLSATGNAQTKKPVRKTAQAKTTKTPEPPSANGKFKFNWTKGLVNDTDGKDFIVISAQGKPVSDIKSSVLSIFKRCFSFNVFQGKTKSQTGRKIELSSQPM
jgi:hypothetical protein